MVEHLTADQEVPSSNLGVPYFLWFLDSAFFIATDSFFFPVNITHNKLCIMLVI